MVRYSFSWLIIWFVYQKFKYNIIKNRLVQFKDSLVNDLTATGNLINDNLKQQLGPLASGLSDMMTNLFSGFMSNLQQQQIDQSNSLTNYLPIFGTFTNTRIKKFSDRILCFTITFTRSKY